MFIAIKVLRIVYKVVFTVSYKVSILILQIQFFQNGPPYACKNLLDEEEKSQTTSKKLLEKQTVSYNILFWLFARMLRMLYLNDIFQKLLFFFSSGESTAKNQIVEEEKIVPDDLVTVEKEATSSQHVLLTGRRLIDINHFLTSLKNLKHDGFGCSFFDIEIISEKRYGLKSSFVTKCKMCNMVKSIATEPETNISVNKSAVSACLAVGIGYSQLTEFCSALDVPTMSPNTYSLNENSLSNVINKTTYEATIEAGKEEKALAIEAGDVDVDGIPHISVIVDGAWCKRSYKSNYNASSGVACIIGARTKKILYVGVKNKYCQLCEKYIVSKRDIPQHSCYKNWNGTSTSMEAEIILEGFRCSLDMHGVMYKKIIGDGDSSVYNKIKNSKPYGPNVYIEKIECRNHILRNYCNKIKEFAKCSKLSPKIRSLFRHVLRFRTAVVSAVKFRKAETKSFTQQICNLRNDIYNGPKHIFGCHDHCPVYFCNGPKENEKNLWLEFKESAVFLEFNRHLTRVANNASSLLHDVDTNMAECYNSIVNKLVGGKRINFSKKGSYQNRCIAAVANYNNKRPFFYDTQKQLASKVGSFTEKFCLKSKVVKKKYVRRNKVICQADGDYGKVVEVVDDIVPDEFEKIRNNFLTSLENADCETIEKNTRGQSLNPKWLQERVYRLTSSNFGRICKMRPTTSTASIIKNLIYNTNNIRSAALQHGIIHEGTAREHFESTYSLDVQECGMLVHPQHKFLAASPDGLVGDDAILEIKCPYAARNMQVAEAVEKKIIDYCYMENKTIKLKENHNYMYQIQGLLEIANRECCYFFIYTLNDFHCELIIRNKQFWEEKMIKKLEKFYFSAYLLELLDSRYNRKMDLRDIKCEDL